MFSPYRASEETLTSPTNLTGPTKGDSKPDDCGKEVEAKKITRPTPWSVKRLALVPPVMQWRLGMITRLAVARWPFPRHNHGSPTIGTSQGELFIFGGMASRVLSNELYRLSTNENSMSLVQASGDVPSARYMHAVALVGSVLIVWGGKCVDDKGDTNWLDDGLYLLNLGECGHSNWCFDVV